MRQKLDVGILAWTFLGCQKGWPETPGNWVLVSVESHEASSFVVRSFVLQLSLPQGEASIIIKPLQPTTASVCACVAPTSGGGSPPAFDRATKEVDMAHGEKHALITGSSRGIGRGIAQALAESGVKVAIHYYQNEPAARETLAQVRRRGSDGVLVQADVTRPEQITDMFHKVQTDFGTLDIFVSNARPEDRKSVV